MRKHTLPFRLWQDVGPKNNLSHPIHPAIRQHRQRVIPRIPCLNQCLRIKLADIHQPVSYLNLSKIEMVFHAHPFLTHINHNLADLLSILLCSQQAIHAYAIGHVAVIGALKIQMQNRAVTERHEQISNALLDHGKFAVQELTHFNTFSELPQQRGTIFLKKVFHDGVVAEPLFRHTPSLTPKIKKAHERELMGFSETAKTTCRPLSLPPQDAPQRASPQPAHRRYPDQCHRY